MLGTFLHTHVYERKSVNCLSLTTAGFSFRMGALERSARERRTVSPFSHYNSMKRNLLLFVAMTFALSSALSAQTVITPFNGTNLDGWNFKRSNWENCWQVGRVLPSATALELVPAGGVRGQGGAAAGQRPQGQGGQGQTGQGQGARAGVAFVNMVGTDWNQDPRKGVDIYTEQKFGDCTVKLEFLITRGSNSGVYLMGEYEVQISDSFARPPGRQLGQGDMGAIYSAAAPSRNAAGVPGTWQTYEIEFVAPKFDAQGNKTANAVFKRVVLNGVLVQENVEVQGPTGGGLTMQEAATGPLMLQGDHGPVAFRNIEIIVP